MTILIAGGGIPGLTLALALKRGLGNVSVTVCDPAMGRDPAADLRASAVAAGARRMFEQLGVWAGVAGETQPIVDMIITDSRLADVARPVFLTFADEPEPGEPFAHMVENGILVTALLGACAGAGVRLVSQGVARIDATADGVTVRLADGQDLRAALLVGADGVRSSVREMAGLGWVGWSYGQSALVATIAHERDHEGRAREHFLPSGPFAILPLARRRSSIVWTEQAKDAASLMAFGTDEILREIERRFGLALGALTLETALRAYPVAFGVARRFAGDRLALIGDAAHVIHPLAGQGLNLGLRDVAALAEAIADAVRLGLDPGDATVLAAYERARRFDTLAMGAATDGLNRLFSNDALPVRLTRDLGLGLVDRLPALKRFLIHEAAGLAGELPRLMRGEAL